MRILPFRRDFFNIGIKAYNENKIIVFPTDTVYGLGGNPFNSVVVERILDLKGRRDKPLPILVSSLEKIYKIAHVDDKFVGFLKEIWPGKITVILPSRVKLPAALYGQAVGIRIPGDKTLLAFIEEIGGYLIGTSSNISGLPPAVNINESIKYFGDKVAIYYDGGPRKSKSSTVIKLSGDAYEVLRFGAVSKSYIDKVFEKYI